MSNKQKDFYSLLKKKSRAELPEGFDQRFFDKLEKQIRPRPSALEWLLPLAFASMLILIIYRTSSIHHRPQILSAQVMQEVEFLENMELLETLQEVELSEVEWEILLGENSAF